MNVDDIKISKENAVKLEKHHHDRDRFYELVVDQQDDRSIKKKPVAE